MGLSDQTKLRSVWMTSSLSDAFPIPPIQPLLWSYQAKPFGKCNRCGVYTQALHYQLYQTGMYTSEFTNNSMCQECFSRQHWNFLYSGQHPFPLKQQLSSAPEPIYVASAHHRGAALIRSILFQAGIPTPSRDAIRAEPSGMFGENRWATETGLHIAASISKRPRGLDVSDDILGLVSKHADIVHSFGMSCRGVVTSVIASTNIFYLAHALTDYGKVIVTSHTRPDLLDPKSFADAVEQYTNALPVTAHKSGNLFVVDYRELVEFPDEQLKQLSQFLRMPMPHHTSTY